MALLGLKPDTSYAVSVSAVNEVGVGIAAKLRIMTAPGTGQYSLFTHKIDLIMRLIKHGCFIQTIL